MITNQVQGDIFAAPQRHIAFAVNVEGLNDSGFAGKVAERFWPELANIGKNKLGKVLTRKEGEKTYYALVCHSLTKRNGWKTTPKVVRECLDKLRVPKDEEIAVVLMGSGPVGQLGGANVSAIVDAIDAAKKKVVVFTLSKAYMF